MTAGVEAPVQSSVLRLVVGAASLLDDAAPDAAVQVRDSARIKPRARLTAGDASPAICDVVAAWRTADRELAGLVENEPERNRVRAEIIGLRALHHRLFDERLSSRPGDGDATRLRAISRGASTVIREGTDQID